MRTEIRLSIVLATVALLAALCGVGGAIAGTALIGSKQIKNGSVKSIDLKNDGVKSSDLAPNSVEGEAIAPASVEGEALALPEPTECSVTGTEQFAPPPEFERLAGVCSFTKVEATSVVEVNWNGPVEGRNQGEASGCVFQLRINGQPSPQGGGEFFGKGLTTASAAAIFTGLAPGTYSIEVWARGVLPEDSMGLGSGDRCVVGPPRAGGVAQTVDVSEAVV